MIGPQHAEGVDDGIEQTAPVWAVFGDLMSGLLGAFVLILVGVLVVQMDLVAHLESEVQKRRVEEQRRMALEKALAIPLASGRVSSREALLLFAALCGLSFMLVLLTNAATVWRKAASACWRTASASSCRSWPWSSCTRTTRSWCPTSALASCRRMRASSLSVAGLNRMLLINSSLPDTAARSCSAKCRLTDT